LYTAALVIGQWAGHGRGVPPAAGEVAPVYVYCSPGHWSVGGAWAWRTPAAGWVAAVYCILQSVTGQSAGRRKSSDEQLTKRLVKLKH